LVAFKVPLTLRSAELPNSTVTPDTIVSVTPWFTSKEEVITYGLLAKLNTESFEIVPDSSVCENDGLTIKIVNEKNIVILFVKLNKNVFMFFWFILGTGIRFHLISGLTN
jgi:hypothetical protein